MIKCSKCKEEKLEKDFSPARGHSSGLNSWCKVCCNAWYHKKHTENPEKYRERDRARRLKPEVREREKVKQKEYRDNNRDKKIAAMKKWREENKEYVQMYDKSYKDSHKDHAREVHRKYILSHPEITIAMHNNRRARKKAVSGTITKEQWVSLCEKYGNMCLRCKKKDVKLTLDHIIPLDPGLHVIENAQPLCKPCNSSKGRKTIDYRPF